MFDYTASPLQDQLKRHVEEDKKPFDLIVDTVGVQELYRNSASYLSVSSIHPLLHLFISTRELITFIDAVTAEGTIR